MYFSAHTEGRISYGHLGRTNSCYYFIFSYFCCKYVNKRSVFSFTLTAFNWAEPVFYLYCWLFSVLGAFCFTQRHISNIRLIIVMILMMMMTVIIRECLMNWWIICRVHSQLVTSTQHCLTRSVWALTMMRAMNDTSRKSSSSSLSTSSSSSFGLACR